MLFLKSKTARRSPTDAQSSPRSHRLDPAVFAVVRLQCRSHSVPPLLTHAERSRRFSRRIPKFAEDHFFQKRRAVSVRVGPSLLSSSWNPERSRSGTAIQSLSCAPPAQARASTKAIAEKSDTGGHGRKPKSFGKRKQRTCRYAVRLGSRAIRFAVQVLRFDPFQQSEEAHHARAAPKSFNTHSHTSPALRPHLACVVGLQRPVCRPDIPRR